MAEQYEKSRAEASTPAIVAAQELFFTGSGRAKRGPPSPEMSGMSTLLGTDATMQTATQQTMPQQPLVQPLILEDHTADQATASGFGVNINDQGAMQEFLNQPVHTAGDVLKLVKGYHKAVIRPEMFGMVAQLETAIKKVHDHTFTCQKELQFMVADNRSAQKHAAGLQLVTTGWPNGLTPQQREYMLGWMLGNTPEIVTYLQARGLLAQNYDHTALSPNGYASFWFNVLSTEPVTVPQKGGFFSGMTLATFKSWDLRSAFLRRYGGAAGMPLYIDQNTPQPNRHIRVSPFTPQWQRKLEAPLRVLIAACNAHPETQGKRLIILWKTLTLMQPTDDRDFKPDHTAWARLFYEERDRTFRGRLEVVQEFAALLNGPPLSKTEGEETLWSECWNQTIWGNQLELDEMERAAYHTARQQAVTSGSGTNFGRGRKHWSQSLLHQSTFSPYPFELDFCGVDKVAFVWDELCDKCQKPDEKIGSYEVATYAGKPAAPASASDHTATDLPADPFSDAGLPSTWQPKGGAKAEGKGSQSSQATPPRA